MSVYKISLKCTCGHINVKEIDVPHYASRLFTLPCHECRGAITISAKSIPEFSLEVRRMTTITQENGTVKVTGEETHDN